MILALMPLGVEHIPRAALVAEIWRVILALMPLGVEHAIMMHAFEVYER